MTDMKRKPKKWGWRKTSIFYSILVGALLLAMFGGRGTTLENLEQYAVNYTVQVGVVEKSLDVAVTSTVAVAGTQSRIVVMHLEDGRSAAVTFTKVPVINRWKMTATTFPDGKSNTVFIHADASVQSLLIKTDGKGYMVEDTIMWDGTYGKYLTSILLWFGLFVIAEVLKKVWVRYKSRVNVRIEG